MPLQENPEFHAIVIGSGITGGWAAKELTEKGLSVLLLERGKMIEHGKDYRGEHMPPWQIPFGGLPLRDLYDRDYFIQRKSYAFDETTRHFWNNDRLNPYLHENNEFNWMRTDTVGGRSLVWGRHVYRWSDLDFSANANDGHGVDWPIRYTDIEPWYRYVERFIGVSGQAEQLPHLPDGEFLPPMELNVAEEHIRGCIARRFPGRLLTPGRLAILTRAHNGRAPCHYCGPCHRGCSTGSYFSTQSSTLPAAIKTGKLTLKSDVVVEKLNYDPERARIASVDVIDTRTHARKRHTARMVFLCASTVGSTQILLNSSSESFPNGLGNRSGALGRYLMDHTMASSTTAIVPGMLDRYVYGNRPSGIYLPRFRNLQPEREVDFVRGYGYQGGAKRMTWQNMIHATSDIGERYKDRLSAPGPWSIRLVGLGECLPYRTNAITLNHRKLDRFGVPQVQFAFSYRENEHRMVRDMATQAEVMLRSAGCMDIKSHIEMNTGGDTIHEMGTARMGRDPQTSVLNRWNQVHDVPNLFVTDGSCMASSSCVNPSLTYMALTARAADYAAKEFKAGRI
ncbi:GMC oxidoreductase [Parahaliea mediterranea]|uniref:GMC oxidoreductase n=1 Tax=Parahaliea mediterranea TaxID=651086 RepID=UPI000E2F5DC4|nr:GMC family oxidoreductase [Parahaliea mediterranea]